MAGLTGWGTAQSTTRKRDPVLDECSQDAWDRFWPAFRGSCGINNCKLPLQFERAGDHGLTPDEYDKQGDKVHSLLSVACQNNQEALALLEKHMSDGGVGFRDNGPAALDEIRELCKGGEGMESIEGHLTSLYDTTAEEFDTVRELAIQHQTLVTKVRDLTARSNISLEDFLNMMFKMHLLRLLRCPKYTHQYGNPLTISHSSDETTYVQLQKEIVRISNVLNSTSGHGSEGDMALYGNHKAEKKKKFKCFRCRSTKHLIADCPYESSSEEEEEKPKLGAPSPGTISDRRSRKNAQSAQLAEADTEEETAYSGFGWSC